MAVNTKQKKRIDIETCWAQRPAMIAHLDEVRGFMEELSPELGVTDPVSGNIVSKVGYHD